MSVRANPAAWSLYDFKYKRITLLNYSLDYRQLHYPLQTSKIRITIQEIKAGVLPFLWKLPRHATLQQWIGNHRLPVVPTREDRNTKR